MNTTLTALYNAALAADDAFSRELVRAYGAKSAGDARYLRTHADPAVNAAAQAKVNADAALHKATTEEREAAEFLAAHANDYASLCDAE